MGNWPTTAKPHAFQNHVVNESGSPKLNYLLQAYRTQRVGLLVESCLFLQPILARRSKPACEYSAMNLVYLLFLRLCPWLLPRTKHATEYYSIQEFVWQKAKSCIILNSELYDPKYFAPQFSQIEFKIWMVHFLMYSNYIPIL